MRFSEYIKQNHSDETFNYIGEIYGSDEWSGTGEDIADLIDELGDESEYIDHPTIGGRNGFYFESGDIHYHDENGGQECVFEAL